MVDYSISKLIEYVLSARMLRLVLPNRIFNKCLSISSALAFDWVETVGMLNSALYPSDLLHGISL